MLGSVLVLMLPLLVWLTPDLRIKKSLLKCNFIFQAEDGIRNGTVTGVQTCALPISRGSADSAPLPRAGWVPPRGRRLRNGQVVPARDRTRQIGRASCRERE